MRMKKNTTVYITVKNTADNTHETDLRKYISVRPELVEGLNERMKAFLIYRRRYGSTGSPRTAYVKAHHERLMLRLSTNYLGIDSPLHYVKY